MSCSVHWRNSCTYQAVWTLTRASGEAREFQWWLWQLHLILCRHYSGKSPKSMAVKGWIAPFLVNHTCAHLYFITTCTVTISHYIALIHKAAPAIKLWGTKWVQEQGKSLARVLAPWTQECSILKVLTKSSWNIWVHEWVNKEMK